jgi:cytochrome c553
MVRAGVPAYLRFASAWLALLALAPLVLGADEPQTFAPDQIAFFEKTIRPLLVERCEKCHGSEKEWSGLRLDSREAVLKGGDSGAAISVEIPKESLLLARVRSAEAEERMPPKEEPLSEQQIADLEKWIAMGAPFPTAQSVTGKVKRDPNHWSFSPPAEQTVPQYEGVSFVRNPIDAFIYQRLIANEMLPAVEADRSTLLRRLTFDLTGLPPTPEEVDAFVADNSPGAYETVVERLLASPAYGERWGRHWLDVARYSDSNGLDENVCQGNAWRYRDYVVNAFNSDLPFSKFVTEQLAGDLLAAADDAQRRTLLTATGLLTIGPKVLAEVDEAKMQMDIIDEQLDTVGKAFMGLTLGCARCHDHKFDPISTADYYGLAGVFKSTRAMETYTKLARWYENELPDAPYAAAKAAFDVQFSQRRAKVDEFVTAAEKTAKDSLPSGAAPPEKIETLFTPETTAEIKKMRDELAAFEKEAPVAPSAMGVKEDKAIDVAVHLRGSTLKLGDVVPRRVPSVVKGPEAPTFTGAQSGRLELAAWLTDPRHPLASRVYVNRVWSKHFGVGLVKSVDNFGLLGETPSHPELLDWLARQFIESDGSTKAIHRLIVTSSTYRQSTLTTAEMAAHDPANQWYGCAPVRRLEAEAIRDSLLTVSSRIDMEIGGSLLKVKNRDYFFDHTSIDKTDYSSTRRSLYLPVLRNNVHDVFQLLDFPDPSVATGSRAATTIAPQALLMLNSPLVIDSSLSMAKRLNREANDDVARIALGYRLCFGRPASEQEIAEGKQLLAELRTAFASDPASDEKALAAFCQTLLASNEFIYLR